MCFSPFLLLVASTSYAQQPTWTHVSPSGTGPLGGGPISQNTVYDTASDRLVVFGFSDPLRCCNESNDTWVLINATGSSPTWQQLTPNAPAGLPQGRIAHSAVYDAATNRMIIFGGGRTNGFAFGPLFNDVWVLTHANGLGGTPEWVPRTPTGGPPAPREGLGGFYKQATNEMIIFGGGNNGIMSVPNDLWSLQNANSIDVQPTWVQVVQAGDVPGRIEHFASAFAPASNTWTIALGCCGYTNAARTLALTAQWTNLSPGGNPPPGGDAQNFFYDQDTNSLYVQTNGPGGWSSATWLLSGVNTNGATSMWTNIIPKNAPGTPPDSGDVSLMGSAYNAATKKFIVALSHTDPLANRVPEVWVLSFGLLGFPLAGKFPDNTENTLKCDAANSNNNCFAAISAVMDHDVNVDPVAKGPLFYRFNKRVGAYTGEEGVENCGNAPCLESVGTHALLGYRNTTSTPFVINGNYTGGSGCVHGRCEDFLFYTGHAGFDYPATLGTEITAPADGLLFVPTANSATYGEPVSTFNVLGIDHGNGYASWFLHLGCQPGTKDPHCALNSGDFRGIDAGGNSVCSYAQLTTTGCLVKRGDVIGLVGNKGLFPSVSVAHLHFEVRKGLTQIPGGLPICSSPTCLPVDPYGWSGNSPDPYSQFLGGPNIRLWR